MFEALEASIKYVFEDLKIHRVMANYMPINTRSAKLLYRLGFIIEGYAENYLLIKGQWEDHILTALSIEQWRDIHDKKILALDSRSKAINNSLIYREVRVADAPFLVPLMEQLGYPIDPTIMRENIEAYVQLPNQKAWVQAVLKKIGEKSCIPTEKNKQRDEYPLRGVLLCPACNRNLTGSPSRSPMAPITTIIIVKIHVKPDLGLTFCMISLMIL